MDAATDRRIPPEIDAFSCPALPPPFQVHLKPRSLVCQPGAAAVTKLTRLRRGAASRRHRAPWPAAGQFISETAPSRPAKGATGAGTMLAQWLLLLGEYGRTWIPGLPGCALHPTKNISGHKRRSTMSSAQVKPSPASDSGSIHESASFAAHLKTIERKIRFARALRKFHRRPMGRAGQGRLFRQYLADHRAGDLQDRPLASRGRRARDRCGARGRARVGPDSRGRARRHPQPASRTGWSNTCRFSRRSRPTTTASRSARRTSPTCRWRSIISVTSRAACAPRKARSANSTTTRSPITITSPSAWWDRSFPGTSRS